MSNVEIFHCNKTYNEKWLEDKASSNGIQYKIIFTIIKLIQKNDGGRINQKEVLDYAPDIKEYIERRPFKIIPSSGTEFIKNGRGIHHAKYAPTKSVAVIWQKIGDTIFVTFDDHAPVKYHRAIHSFHKLRIGKPVFPLNSKCSKLVREILNSKTPWRYKGIDLRDRAYYSK